MRRLFWLALGATVGVLVVRRMGRVAQSFTPDGMAASVGNGLAELGDGLREAAAAVRETMHQREDELRYALGLDVAGVGGPQPGARMTNDEARALLQDPAGPHRPSA